MQAYGSDWPVAPLGALRGMYAAAQRREPGTSDISFVGAECVQAEVALRAHTAGAAYAAFMEHEVGMLRCARMESINILFFVALASLRGFLPTREHVPSLRIEYEPGRVIE